MKDDSDLIADIEIYFDRARLHSDKWRTQARESYDFTSGVQWNNEDARVLEAQSRPAVTFNRIRPMINAVAGSEVANRQEVRYIPRELGDSKVNELLTAAAKWIRDECNAEDEESDAFRDMLISGMGWTETHVEYDEDADGKIYIDRVDPIEMYWDPGAKKQNISDARWVARVRRYSRDALVARWGEAKIDEIIGLTNTSDWEREADDDAGEPHDATNAWRYENDLGSDLSRVPRYKVLEYQWIEMERFYRVPNPSTGQLEDVASESFKVIRERLDASGVPYTDVRKRRAYRAFVIGKNVLERGPGPGDEAFTYKCLTAYRDRNRGYWLGLVDAMKDPQRWANKFFAQILHIVNSNSKGGLLVERDATSDIGKLKEEWARPDGVVELEAGAIAGGKIKEKPFAPYPAGVDRMMEVAISAIRDVTGINLELLGLADRTQAGVLEYQRKQAGLTMLATLFDALRRYRKEQGRLLLAFIRKYVADGRLIRVTGDRGAQYAPLAKLPETARYDVVIDDAPTSPNQKEQAFAVMSQITPILAKLGVAPPAEALDYLPLPTTLIEKWKQQIAASAQQPSPEEMRMQADAQRIQAETQAATAKLQMDARSAQMDFQTKIAENQLALRDLELRTAQMQADFVRAQADAEAKRSEQAMAMRDSDRDFDLERMKLAQEQERINLERDKLDVDVRSKGGMLNKEVQSLLDAQAQISQALAALGEAHAQTSMRMNAPKRIIRDERGRAVGVEAVGTGDMMRIARDEQGRPVGLVH